VHGLLRQGGREAHPSNQIKKLSRRMHFADADVIYGEPLDFEGVLFPFESQDSLAPTDVKTQRNASFNKFERRFRNDYRWRLPSLSGKRVRII
jgi:hypothetical protein